MKRRNQNVKATSSVISTVILTGVMVALISVALVFVNNRLWANVAESDFSSAKQFMQTIGLQIDDVAWTIGRKATVRYSSTYGTVNFLPSALNYTVYVNDQFFASYKVGVLLFNIPVSRFSLYDGLYELIYPSLVSTLTFTGTSAPVARVFAVEKLTPPMSDGSFIRIVVAPSIRLLFSTTNASGTSTSYIRLYLPVLVQGSAQGSYQSVTLTGNNVTANTKNQVTSVNVTVDFPSETSQQGFDASFFHFPSSYQVIPVPPGYSNSVLEFYSGEVKVELGAYS